MTGERWNGADNALEDDRVQGRNGQYEGSTENVSDMLSWSPNMSVQLRVKRDHRVHPRDRAFERVALRHTRDATCQLKRPQSLKAPLRNTAALARRFPRWGPRSGFGALGRQYPSLRPADPIAIG